MIIYEDDINKVKEELVYLMLFKDHKRIDLSLVEFRNRNRKNDSLTKILLDKDKIFEKNQSPSDKDYWTKKPSQKEFNDCCNEFWWVSTYVVKGLLRNELIYAKEIHETIVRKMYMKVIAWNIAADHRVNIQPVWQIPQTNSDTNGSAWPVKSCLSASKAEYPCLAAVER